MGGTVQQAGIGPAEGLEVPLVQGLADAGHQFVIEVQIVEHSQAHGQHLPRGQQVPEVGTGEAPAGGPHYEALFLLGVVLFFITLIINFSVEYISSKGIKRSK